MKPTNNQLKRRLLAKLAGGGCVEEWQEGAKSWWTRSDGRVQCPACKQVLMVERRSNPNDDVAQVHGYNSYEDWITACQNRT